MKFLVSYYHYVQCDTTHVRSTSIVLLLHFWAGAAHTGLSRVYPVSARAWAIINEWTVKTKKPKTSKKRSNLRKKQF